MTGAAGGLAGGLWAAFDAKLGLRRAPSSSTRWASTPAGRAARAVVTGEGRLDRQSLAGKAMGEVAVRCRQARRPLPRHRRLRRAADPSSTGILDLATVDEATTLEEIEAAARALGERL